VEKAVVMKRTVAGLLALALVVAFAADANAAKNPKITVKLQEFTINPLPSAEAKAGKVQMKITNTGSLTHEMVLVRAASVTALPKVTTAGGERKVGAVDEEAIAERDKMGETGDVKAGKTVTKTFKLRPGHYVMFCNIDDAAGNHFARGMYDEFVVTK
jgi:plastocyanin